MVTSTATKQSKDKNKKIYPYLGITRRGFIVLFTSKATGTVIYSPDGSYNPLGEHSTEWAEESNFEIYNGRVELIND